MPNTPLITTTVKITAKDINGNNTSKQFNQVRSLVFDYNDATINIIDVTGSFYFTLLSITSFTYTIVPGVGGTSTVVMS
jgi:hypothetical protein